MSKSGSTLAAEVPTLMLRTFAAPVELRTPRLLLRQWKDSDIDAWCEMNADPEVRRYFPKVNAREDSMGELERIRGAIAQRGWGMWAVEVPGVIPFAGFVGLNPPGFPAPWQPAVEIGWRLCQQAWHQGYATEGAMASLSFAFRQLELPFVVALSVTTNAPSHAVMTRIGMTPWPGVEFDHPRVPSDWPLKRHIVHRIDREQFIKP
ncbi:MAG: GNAT family N-acetyltransferase [Burkholderiales bacterium]|jgi:RimJ/RimL family protein N-acetyltransferase|nr:GNAT family N-acetyltransferase [Nitrosomonadaceae bacterium]